MKFRLLLVVLGFVFLAAACGPTPEIRSDSYLRDISFLTSEPCGPPCWRNITPGETRWDDALIIIEDDRTLTQLETQAAEDSASIGAAWGQAETDTICCQMVTEDGEIVSFLIVQTTPASTLEELIEVHGEPDYLIAETYSDDQGLFNLFYEDVPMMIYVFVAGQAGELGPTSEVVGFAYMTQELMDSLINTNPLYIWRGYQSYQDYMGSEFDITPVPTDETDDPSS